jgi:hypothetical protein
MTAGRRVAAVEASLDSLAIVLKVIAECQEYGSLDACARAIAEAPVEAAPLSRIGAEIAASVRASMKGRPRDEIDRAVSQAVGDGVFRFILFLRLNTSALEIADHDGLAAAALTFWMGSLVGGPREDDMEPAAWADHQEDQARNWDQWRSLVATLLVKVTVEDEAREQLEASYLGGQSTLFADTESEWDRYAEMVDRLWSLATARGEADAPEDEGPDPLADRVAERARHLADDARISTFERIGEMPRAVAIVERRLAR